jgi:Zn-dependent protease
LPALDIGNLILWFVVFLFSLSIHESAHAWTSERFGDKTGRYLGRVSLNPIRHIDPVGTILFPLASQLTGGFMFGWAKPVPVNPDLWSDKKRANIFTSAAGPISNLLLAGIAVAIALALMAAGVIVVNDEARQLADILAPAAGSDTLLVPVSKLISIAIFLNITLGIFNLVPIPPLDGSHILESLLPYEQAVAYSQLRPYGFILLLGLMWFGAVSFITSPFVNLALIILGSGGRV